MPIQRLKLAAQRLGFVYRPGGKLEEALDVTKHLPLALVGDKVLDLVIALAYYDAQFSNGQMTDQITRIAHNNRLIDVGRDFGLQNLLLCSGRAAPSGVPCTRLPRGPQKNELFEPRIGAAAARSSNANFQEYRAKVLADTVEAIVGAAFLEQGLRGAANIISKLRIDELDGRGDPQSGWRSKWAKFEDMFLDETKRRF